MVGVEGLGTRENGNERVVKENLGDEWGGLLGKESEVTEGPVTGSVGRGDERVGR